MLTLFERAAQLSGLSSVLSAGVLRRACERAGVSNPDRINRHELLRALPAIEAALATYLSPAEVKERVAALLQLTRTFSGPIEIRLDDEQLEGD